MSSSGLAGLLSLVVALAPGRVEIVGDATCPAPAEIAARLAELIPAAAGTSGPSGALPAAKIIVARTDRAMRLVLLGPGSNELATRELAAEGSCADLAAAAAVVIAAWRADLNPDLTPSVSLPGGGSATLPVAPSPITVARGAPVDPARPRLFAIGLGLLASETGGEVAPGAILVGSIGLGWGGLALDATASGTTSRSAPVGPLPAAASWTRATLAVGPALHLGHARLGGDVHLQALAGLLHVRGIGVPNAASDTTAELGVGTGARVDVVTGTSAVWLGLDVLTWPGQQRLLIDNSADYGRLPRLEVVGSAGISLGRFP
jgi:hypothetical protein